TSYGLLSSMKSDPANQLTLSLTLKSHRLFLGRSNLQRLVTLSNHQTLFHYYLLSSPLSSSQGLTSSSQV
ncbi:hypothetical protein PanWU01x14_095330, partial [Parasponia andersonii]